MQQLLSVPTSPDDIVLGEPFQLDFIHRLFAQGVVQDQHLTKRPFREFKQFNQGVHLSCMA